MHKCTPILFKILQFSAIILVNVDKIIQVSADLYKKKHWCLEHFVQFILLFSISLAIFSIACYTVVIFLYRCFHMPTNNAISKYLIQFIFICFFLYEKKKLQNY